MNDPLLLPLAAAAKDAYDTKLGYCWEGENKTTHLQHIQINDIHTFVFTGTTDFKEWALDVLAIPEPILDVPQVGDLHAGLALGACQAIYQYILPTLASLGYPPYYLAGHSKGAAQAGQAHGILKALGHGPKASRLYEPPFFGGQMLADLMAGDDVEWTETYNVHFSDFVTHVPLGLSWRRNKPAIRLKVPDDVSLVTIHLMDTVHDAIHDMMAVAATK